MKSLGGLRTMTPEEMKRMMKLAESAYRPKEIVELKARIEGETRVADLRASVTGKIDEAKVQEIVGMKFKLNALYISWVEGKIS